MVYLANSNPLPGPAHSYRLSAGLASLAGENPLSPRTSPLVLRACLVRSSLACYSRTPPRLPTPSFPSEKTKRGHYVYQA